MWQGHFFPKNMEMSLSITPKKPRTKEFQKQNCQTIRESQAQNPLSGSTNENGNGRTVLGD
ncbi:MAG: hypothetical protein O0W93_04850 [Methanocorpusculum sp.]|nr:hypothetical protein [Methanocorpusculum sp.]